MTFRFTRSGICWRPGRWLFAIHPFFTALPNSERFPDGGFTVWWLWFEIAWA